MLARKEHLDVDTKTLNKRRQLRNGRVCIDMASSYARHGFNHGPGTCHTTEQTFGNIAIHFGHECLEVTGQITRRTTRNLYGWVLTTGQDKTCNTGCWLYAVNAVLLKDLILAQRRNTTNVFGDIICRQWPLCYGLLLRNFPCLSQDG